MKIAAIKKLTEIYSSDELMKAETRMMEGEQPSIAVEGDDEGEQLTHIIASIWILEEMRSKKMDFKEALREYTKRVRESIN
jgi:hypothetical protein